jgi:hypothetical protein
MTVNDAVNDGCGLSPWVITVNDDVIDDCDDGCDCE